MSDTHFTRSGSSPGDAFCTSGSSPTRPRTPSSASPFIPEFPIQCTGSFCHGRNIHRDSGKLCPPCRTAKLRHNKMKRTRWWNRDRANRTRQVLRYNRRMELVARRPWLEGSRGLRAFERITGFRVS